MWNGINDKRQSQDANEDSILVANSISDGRNTGLLVIQEVSNDHRRLISMLDC